TDGVDVVEAVQFLRGGLQQAVPSGQQARVVDQHVDPTQFGGDRFDGGGHGVRVGDVAGPRTHRRRARRAVVGSGIVGGDVERGDGGAFGGQAVGDRAAQTTGRAGDDGDASFETGRLHGLSSELGCAVLVGIDATTPRNRTVEIGRAHV